MRDVKTLLVIGAILMLAAGPAAADWDPNYKMHYPQLPDLSDNGMDVLAGAYVPSGGSMYKKLLADDWRCTETGAVTDIHIWGSWLDDARLTDASFSVEIYADIPDPDGTGPLYSMPEQDPLWGETFDLGVPGDGLYYTARLYEDNLNESFYDPNQDKIIGADTEVWQYNFYIEDPTDAFDQTEGTIYWLAITEDSSDGENNVFGWKTSQNHWNDDAVWTDDIGQQQIDWYELRYPTGHAYEGQSIDLSFVITPEPATLALLGVGSIGLVFFRRRKRRSA